MNAGEPLSVTDSLGVQIRVGDRVRVIHYGYSVAAMDVNEVVTVTGLTPRRNVKHDSATVARGEAIRPGCLAVLHRGGEVGLEGNRAFAVQTVWNTDADGAWVEDEDAKPSTFHGPFDGIAAAARWMEDAFPDDTDVYDMFAVPLEDSVGPLNDPDAV